MSHPLAVGDPVARPVAAHERVVALDPRREAVFAAGAAWFAWQLVKSRRRTAAASGRCLHPAPHLVECVAMLYMFFAATPLTARAATPLTAQAAAAGIAGLAPSRFSVLALLMALFMVGYVVRVADRLPLRTPALAAALALAAAPAPAGHVTTTARPYLAPRCAALCKIAMGLTTAYLLILML